MLRKLKPVVDVPPGGQGWLGFHFKGEPLTPPDAAKAEQSEVLLLSMEDVIACLGFTTQDNPLTQVEKYPKILDAVSHLAEKRSPDSITPEQKDAAEKLMEIMRGEALGGGQDQLGASEAAAQLLAMVAADDTKNPHLLYVDRWITTCCTILRRCRPAPGEPSGPCSESLVVCAASCLADLANNPRSTILCSTRASEIFQCLQNPLLLEKVQNRMIFYQACRGLAEILHPSTWPMNEAARIPRRLIQRLHELLSLQPEQPLKGGAPSPTAAAVGVQPATPEVSEARDGAAAAAAAAAADGGEGEGEEGGLESEPVTQEDLIRSQACKVVQFLATSGAGQLLLDNEPRLVPALEGVRSTSTVEEVVLEADSALMSLWLSPKGFSLSDPNLRPVVAEHLLRALGSEDLMDNHQDCSLALVTATMNPVKAARDEALSLFGTTMAAHPDLVRILIGHVEDGDSLAHQSIVYFLLHLLEVESPLAVLAGAPENAAMLVGSLVATACNERHFAPITALVRLVYHPAARKQVHPLLTPPVIQKLRGIPGGRIQKEVDSLMQALLATQKNPELTGPSSEVIDLAAAYREDPSLQSMFFRKLVVSRSQKNAQFKRTKSADDADPTEAGDGGESAGSHVV